MGEGKGKGSVRVTMGKKRILLQGRRAERVEPKPFSSMHDGQLPRHGKHGALARRVCQLRRRRTHQCNNAGGIDHAGVFLAMLPHAQHRVFAPKPHALDVDVVGQVPDLLGRVDGIRVLTVHDPGVVENDVYTAPGVESRDHVAYGRLVGHVNMGRLNAAGVRRKDFTELGLRFCKGRFGDVGHEHGSAFAEEEDGCLEADATVLNGGNVSKRSCTRT